MGLDKNTQKSIVSNLLLWIFIGIIGFYIDYTFFGSAPIWILASIFGPLYILIGIPIKHYSVNAVWFILFILLILYILYLTA